MSDKSADAPRLAFNVREGARRLLIVLAIASACSIGATTWTWIVAERAGREYDSSLDQWEAALKSGNSLEEYVMKESSAATEQILDRARHRFQSFQKWTVISHLIAAATGLLLWAMSGFIARPKGSLTIATDPPRQTGPADTGPPADTEG